MLKLADELHSLVAGLRHDVQAAIKGSGSLKRPQHDGEVHTFRGLRLCIQPHLSLRKSR
jgi:hypothetical protein